MIDLVLDRSTSGVSNILERLRHSTREQHRALDAALSRYDLTQRMTTKSFLRIHLRALTELQSQCAMKTLPSLIDLFVDDRKRPRVQKYHYN